jgi:hypothetical protein
MMMEDLNFVQLGQMPDDDKGLVELYELQEYIDKINKYNSK